MIDHILIAADKALDLAPFFRSSIPRMSEGTFEWPADCLSYMDKEAFLNSRISEIRAHPTSFCYGMTVDGELLAFIVGYRVGPRLRRMISIYKPDANGSLAFVYNDGIIAARDAFFRQNGIETVEGMTTINSPINKQITAHHGAVKYDAMKSLSGIGSLLTYEQPVSAKE